MSTHPYRYTLYTFFGSSVSVPGAFELFPVYLEDNFGSPTSAQGNDGDPTTRLGTKGSLLTKRQCTARVRIAAAHKNIPLSYKFMRLHKGDQHLPSFITAINPSASVPALCVYVHDSDAGNEATPPIAIITQSIAIIEYLEETYPTDIKLLPPLSQPLLRAKVRELVGVVACDIQPLTNMRVFKHVASLLYPDSPPKNSEAADEPWEWREEEWARHFMTLGLSAYERLCTDSVGAYSVGYNLTMADVCLVAAVDRAERYQVDMAQFPVVKRVDAEIRKLDCYIKGGFRSQPDTFRSLREGEAQKL